MVKDLNLRCLSVESRRQGEGLQLGHTVQVPHRTLGKVKVVWRDLNAHKMTTLLEKVSGGGQTTKYNIKY